MSGASNLPPEEEYRGGAAGGFQRAGVGGRLLQERADPSLHAEADAVEQREEEPAAYQGPVAEEVDRTELGVLRGLLLDVGVRLGFGGRPVAEIPAGNESYSITLLD